MVNLVGEFIVLESPTEGKKLIEGKAWRLSSRVSTVYKNSMGVCQYYKYTNISNNENLFSNNYFWINQSWIVGKTDVFSFRRKNLIKTIVFVTRFRYTEGLK